MSECKEEIGVVKKEEEILSEKEIAIKVIDAEGYDIEQFLCRCSNKTTGGVNF